MELTLKQSAVMASWKLTLEKDGLSYLHAEAFSHRKTIPYRQITGIFRDAERAYIVWGREVAQFLHQPTRDEYNSFVAQLLRQVKSANGA